MKRICLHLLNAAIVLLLIAGCRNPQAEELDMLKKTNLELN